MPAKYPAEYETGDIVFIHTGATLFRQVSAASRCWCNHVGIITGHNGEDYLVAESRIPLSGVTTLGRFIRRSVGDQYAVRRIKGGLTETQKRAVVEQIPPRLYKVYHTGFDYDSSRQFCSKFVFDICREALSISVGKKETFRELLEENPDTGLTFWRFWFLGAIPWNRSTVTPASLWQDPGLILVHNSHHGGGSAQNGMAPERA